MAVVATLSKGYDLEYIWKQVDRGPIKDAAGYYLQASESGGEPPGRWWGPGAKALGLEPGQVVERGAYDLLFGQRKAPDGTPLGKPPADGRKAEDLYARLLAAEPHATAERQHELRIEATRQAGQGLLFFDLTISVSKSISIFHASLGENVRLARQAGDQAGEGYWSGLVAEVDEMIWQAVRAGFGYFQREAGYTRTGSHNTRVHGRETGQWHEADLAVAHWLQHTSRNGDMQLHVHSQIAHTARTVTDGKWRAPDSFGYNEHIGAVAATVSQHLEEALTARFGLAWEARDDGHGFEIRGISGEMIRLFSSRRQSITADLRAAWHEALAALGPIGGLDVRGMPDGRLLHLRDSYPIETAWAPQYVGDELRQVRAAAREARLAGLRSAADAAAAASRGDHDTAARQQDLAASYHALHQAYLQRETVFVAVMADRADWEAATRSQRHLAVAADAELRRRHPSQPFPPLRSAEPEPATETQRTELSLTPGEPPGEMGQWIKDLAAVHRTFAERLANLQSLTIPLQDPDYGDLGQAFLPWPRPGRDAILQPPKPEIRPSPYVLERAADRDAGWEAAD